MRYQVEERSSGLLEASAVVSAPFWREAIIIGQEHDTQNLKDEAIAVAEQAPQIDTPAFIDTVEFAEEAHKGQTRDLTGEKYINHVLQVFLLATKIAGITNVTTTNAQIWVLHDTIEDTPTTRENIEVFTGDRDVGFGVYTMSHKANGKDLFPDDIDRKMYLGGIASVHNVRPELGLGEGKTADLFLNGNGPLTVQEIRNPTAKRVAFWADLSGNKLTQMGVLKGMLRKEDINLQHRLGGAIAFTETRLDPDVQPFFETAINKTRKPLRPNCV